MKEEFLQYVWANSLFKNRDFTTVSGKKLEIIDTGKYNRDAGPDFFNARLRIDGVEWAGNVEVHCRNSDWNRHGHPSDSAYNNVILSVVGTADTPIYNQQGREIETLVLEYAEPLYREYLYLTGNNLRPGCRYAFGRIDPACFRMALQSLAIERLERKCRNVRLVWEQTRHDWEECFYRMICKYWTGNLNAEPFYQLAAALPYRTLLRYADKPLALEALLLGTSGLLDIEKEDDYIRALKTEYQYLKNKHNLSALDAGQWKFMRVRPGAFPNVRLVLLAVFLRDFRALLSKVLQAASVKDLEKLLDVRLPDRWTKHFFPEEGGKHPCRMGLSLKRILIINAIVPFAFLYGNEQGQEDLQERALAWLEECPPENNYIVRAWSPWKASIESALQTQALIELTKEYCENHRCLKCRLSREIFKRADNPIPHPKPTPTCHTSLPAEPSDTQCPASPS